MKRIIILAGFVVAVLTAGYLVITVYDENLTAGRMWETPAVRPHEQKLQIMETGVIPFDGGEALFKATRGEA